MAELQLRIKYQPAALRYGFYAMCALLPLWSIVIPVAFAGFTYIILFMHLAPAATWIAFGFWFGLLLLTFAGFMTTAVCEDDLIYATKSGISFPLFLWSRLKFRRTQPWLDMTNAALIEQSGNHTLLMQFGGGTHVTVDLKNVDKEKIESLLVAIEMWGARCERTPQLIEYQRQIQKEKVGAGQLSYTEIWEDELRHRFSATTFVPLEPGHKLQNGRLSIVRQMAFGGFAAIYLAQRDGTELVVLKEAVVPANVSEHERQTAERHLLREADMLLRLDHPQIAHVREHFVDDQRHYLVMDRIDGQDFRQFVRQHGVPDESKVLDWAKQIASILQYLHGQDPPIIHRDLTPDNIVLRNDGKITVIDFGAANEFVGTATGTLIGKQAYIAPEQLRGKAVPQSDIYALGGTLYFLLTGQEPKPLSKGSPREKNPSVGEAFDAVVQACTAFDTGARLKDAGEVLTRLEAISPAVAEAAPAGV